MTALPKHKMTVDEFLAWSAMTPGRFELLHGQVHEMSAERTGHAKVKYRAQKALEAGIQRAGLACHMLPDGLTVRVDKDSAYEPDALVYCGEELSDDAIEVPAPVIVVEVSSPSTRRVDVGLKLVGYFGLPSLQHYLIIDPERPPMILHSRQADGAILTRLVSSGSIRLEPPGFDFVVDGLI
jgi:Uma2 family endonuclease